MPNTATERLQSPTATPASKYQQSDLDNILKYLEHKLEALQHDFNLARADGLARLIIAVVMADYADIRDYVMKLKGV